MTLKLTMMNQRLLIFLWSIHRPQKELSTQLITKYYLIGLNHYNDFSGSVNDWFSSYSNNRKQTIQVGQQVSDKANITRGVPQGSGLDRLLLLLYVNDIHKCSNKLRFYLFADAYINVFYIPLR